MKKEYETPEMEVIEIGKEDVVTTSCDSNTGEQCATGDVSG